VDELSSLHGELAARITRLVHEQRMQPGTRLFEGRLAQQLGVSRTPIHAALDHLAAQGYVERQRNRGVILVKLPPMLVTHAGSAGPSEALLARIAIDRRIGRLADQVSEQDVMQAYDLTRAVVKEVLNRLADVGVVEHKLGYRWKFVDQAYDMKTQVESFRFRLLIEPAALLEPGFFLAPEWIKDMSERHESFIASHWTEASSVAFFEMNASFHEGLVAGSHNRFFVESLHRLNQRRRLANYDWRHGRERVDQSCHEHLAILDRVEAGDQEGAARLMREHLGLARQARYAVTSAE
jgi:DNA-binding GntR family transcriptional regulator